jgi:pyruvate dehydrogenase E1 component
VAATDYMKAVPDMVSRWVERPFTILGTDGYGRSDTREALRIHFEVSPQQIAYGALHGLCRNGQGSPEELRNALGTLEIDPERDNPVNA